MEEPYFLSKYDPDPLRFYLTATAPETRDTEFSWEDFVERNSPVLSRSPEPWEGANEGNELVATWGTQSVANRMLSFAYKRFDGRVPEPGELDDEDRALLARQALRQPAPLFKKLDDVWLRKSTRGWKVRRPQIRMGPGHTPRLFSCRSCIITQINSSRWSTGER